MYSRTCRISQHSFCLWTGKRMVHLETFNSVYYTILNYFIGWEKRSRVSSLDLRLSRKKICTTVLSVVLYGCLDHSTDKSVLVVS